MDLVNEKQKQFKKNEPYSIYHPDDGQNNSSIWHSVNANWNSKKKKVRGYCVADECVVNDALTITRMFLKPLRKQISHADHLKLQ